MVIPNLNTSKEIYKGGDVNAWKNIYSRGKVQYYNGSIPESKYYNILYALCHIFSMK
jgi:hypothetical protein